MTAMAATAGMVPLALGLGEGSQMLQPLAIAVNSEEIVLPFVAIMAASLGLVLCVPMTTLIAVLMAGEPAPRERP